MVLMVLFVIVFDYFFISRFITVVIIKCNHLYFKKVSIKGSLVNNTIFFFFTWVLFGTFVDTLCCRALHRTLE